MEKLERIGCPKPVVGLVVPTGYSFNLDGTSIYMTMAALFVAQASGVHLSFSQQLSLLGILLLTSKGAAAVTGSRVHHPGRHAVRVSQHPARRPGAAARRGPLHVGGAGDHQSHRQRGGDDGDRAVGRRARHAARPTGSSRTECRSCTTRARRRQVGVSTNSATCRIRELVNEFTNSGSRQLTNFGSGVPTPQWALPAAKNPTNHGVVVTAV